MHRIDHLSNPASIDDLRLKENHFWPPFCVSIRLNGLLHFRYPLKTHCSNFNQSGYNVFQVIERLNTVFVILRALVAYKIRKRDWLLEICLLCMVYESVTVLTGKVHGLVCFNRFDIVYNSHLVYFTYVKLLTK